MQDYDRMYGVYSVPPAVNSDPIYWGLTFFYAYRAYKQQSLLDLAMVIYNMTYTDAFITPDAATRGTGAGRGTSFIFNNCSTLTYAGGVFWTKDADNDTQINAETVAPFLALSAYLYEETNQDAYKQAAQLTTDFTLNHMWNGTIFQDTLFPATCTTKDLSLTLSQWFVEGLAVWANITKNDTLTSFLNVVVPNVTTFAVWALDDGVIKEGFGPADIDTIDKGIFVRALAEARARNPGTSLSSYIEAYITVQFNSILNHALAPNTDFYANSWFGPPNSTFSAPGNIAALDVLNSAFTFLTPTASSPISGSSSLAPVRSNIPKEGTRSSDANPLAGGVAGGVAGIIALVGAFLLWRRRRTRVSAGTQSSVDPMVQASADPMSMAQPFDLYSPVEPASKWDRHHAPRRNEDSSLVAPGSALPSTPTAISGYQPVMAPESVRTPESELPSLVHRLYNVVQDRQRELPPRYDGYIVQDD